MKTDVSIQDLLFGVDQVPVEAVIGTNGHTRRITIPRKKMIRIYGFRHGKQLAMHSQFWRRFDRLILPSLVSAPFIDSLERKVKQPVCPVLHHPTA